MRLVSPEKLCELQRDPERIRNICILAHVDHGKTTLADSLVASNGIISSRLAGRLRYLDSRTDEQERGITMKSSSIALYHTCRDSEFVVNLIDSPGHVDFASEVSTAVRLCDGAIIVVDVIEGVCPQTRSALSIAYIEGLKPILVFNKIDRLITTVQLSPLDAYVHMMQLLEQVNAIMGELFTSDVMEREDKSEEVAGTESGNPNEKNLADWQSALEEADDSNLYFSPENGNVLFASAYDGWGFGVKEFAKIFSEKLGFSEKVLLKTLWGDYYLNGKTKRIMKGAQEKAKKPLFVQLILENVWAVYDAVVVRKDKERMSSIAEKLGIKLTTRDLRLTDSRAQLQAILSQWLPLAKACLDMTCQIVPSPNRLTDEKIERLMSGNTDFSALPQETQLLKDAFLACDSSPEAPVIVFVSKMFPVDRKTLPENKAKPLTQEELTQRREIARQRHAEQLEQRSRDLEHSEVKIESLEQPEPVEELAEDVLVAFARVYSGTLRRGSEVFVLGPKHNPRVALERQRNGEEPEKGAVLKDLKSGRHATRATVEQLYLMMGRELELLDSISAGNVVGIGSLEEHVLKTATLSTSIACPSFAELTSLTDPILRVALEPRQPNDLQKLIKGLKMLNQADACAVVHIQETGEIVLNTAGEIHLERCLEDLRTRYAKVEVNVSEPIVPLRETVVHPPKVDMVNEVIEKKEQEASLESWTANRQCCFEIDAKPLPEAVTKTLEKHADLIKLLDQHVESLGKEVEDGVPDIGALSLKPLVLPERTLKAVEMFRTELRQGFEDNGEKDMRLERIWCFGPRKCGPNILINETNYDRKPFWERQSKSADPRAV